MIFKIYLMTGWLNCCYRARVTQISSRTTFRGWVQVGRRKPTLRNFEKAKKSRKPITLEHGCLSGPVTLRFGNFAGIRDLRGTRCPLHGIKHGVHPKPGERCACQQATLFPSPLARFSCDQSAVLGRAASSTRVYDSIADEFSSLYF